MTLGRIYMMPMGVGVSSDELTALLSDVLKGKTAVTSDSGDEAAAGTLELTGNAADSHVLAGKTYYNTNAKGKRTGTMPNRGNLNWSGNNTTYNVPAGYYGGGTLDSRPSYNAGVAAADGRVNTNSASYKNGYNAGVAAGKKGISGIRWTTLLTDTIVNGQNRDSVSATIPSNVGGNVIVLATSSVYDPNTPTPVSMTVNGAACQLFRPSNNGGAVIGIAPPGATIVFKGTYNRGPQHIIIAYGIPQ